MRVRCQQQCVAHGPRSEVSGDIRLIPLVFAGEVVSNESAVGENESFLFRSLYLSDFHTQR